MKTRGAGCKARANILFAKKSRLDLQLYVLPNVSQREYRGWS